VVLLGLFVLLTGIVGVLAEIVLTSAAVQAPG
jgi:hypothetical protein